VQEVEEDNYRNGCIVFAYLAYNGRSFGEWWPNVMLVNKSKMRFEGWESRHTGLQSTEIST
jgi:hypothetical protein